jgi:Phosphopantetheine attachment site
MADDMSTWRAALSTLPAEAMDCVEVNLGLLAERAHGAGTAVRLGAVMRFTASGLRADVTQVTDSAARLGLSAGPMPDPRPVDGTRFVLADAYELPWTPYAGRRHLSHGFLLHPERDGYRVTDAYHNDTPWGSARPGTWRLDAAAIGEVLDRGRAVDFVVHAVQPPRDDTDAILTANAAALSADRARMNAYADGLRADPDPDPMERLTLDVWLWHRRWRLHAAWYAACGRADRRLAGHVEAWAELARLSYLAHRRAVAGRAVPPDLPDRVGALLHDGIGLSAWLARRPAALTGPDARVRGAVLEETCAVLGLEPGEVAGTPLRELPGFDSFRLVSIVDRIERRLRVQLDGADLVPGNLHDIDALTAVFGSALAASDAGAPR